MGVALDLIIAALLIFSIVRGYKNGFIKTVFHFGTFIVSLAAAFFFAKPLAEFFHQTQVYQTILGKISESVSHFFSQSTAGMDLSQLFRDRPDSFVRFIEGFGGNIDAVEAEFSRMVADGTAQVNEKIIDYIITPAVDALTLVVAFLILFAACALVLTVVMLLLNSIFTLPILSGANKFGGILAGLVLGILKCFIFCVIINMILPYLGGFGLPIAPDVAEKTLLFRVFSEYNPFSFLYRHS